ncbi:MAG: hypothetical protein Q7T11_02605 [Deltaproteobacteria bacterium]|nr:hypothetical protein [Deltaproteobacteria bacterium]
MARVGLNLKRIFQKEEAPRHPFKQFNALNLMEKDRLREILLFKEREIFSRANYSFEDKKVFFLHEPGTVPLAERIVSGKGYCLHYQARADPSVSLSGPYFFPICGDLKPLSISSGVFDAAVIPGASRFDRDPLPLFPEVVRGLKNGGRLFLTVIHPALELFLTNQNPASVARVRLGLEQYASALGSHQLFLESIREELIDAETKPFIEEEDFQELKGIPLVLYLRAVKYVKEENGL